MLRRALQRPPLVDQPGRHRSFVPAARLRAIARTRVIEYALLSVGLCVATALVTWPHAISVRSHVVSHIDPPFSMWRLAWFAHAVARGEPLLHANIFYPEQYTYLLSDATLLQAATAAPAIWSGIGLPAIYNALLLLGIVSSGVAIYWLATMLGIARAPAAVAALVFSLAPYRIEHIMHLELQWIAPAVIAFGSLYRVLYAPSWRWGLALGLCVWVQFLASVYYALFLLPMLAVVTIIALRWVPDIRRSATAAALAAVVCASLTLPIASLYARQAERVGPRAMSDITMFSATPANYLAAPAENTLYGGTADVYGAGERRLFPGLVALLLAAAGLLSRRRRIVVASAAVLVVAADLSLGVNGLMYRLALEWLPMLHGLRAPARFAVFVLGAVAILAALGCERLLAVLPRAALARILAVTLILAVAGVEYHSPQRRLTRVDMNPPVYTFLRGRPEGSVLELPLPQGRGDAGFDVDYMYWSTRHWRPLVNGYSGYYPETYERMIKQLEGLPDETSLAVLRAKDVRYILVHLTYVEPRRGASLLANLLGHPRFRPLGSYHDWIGPTAVFEVID